MRSVVPRFVSRVHTENKKKADVMKHPEAFNHVGLLVNAPPGRAGLHFI